MQIDTKKTTKDRIISSSTSSLPNTFTFLWPRILENTVAIRTKKVVVRIPPPTLLGDAPINIIADNIMRDGVERRLISIVAKPPLREDTDWKSE